MLISEYFNCYIDAGLRPVALYPETKIPVCRNWNNNWNESFWRNYFDENPDSNIGVLLGKYVDVEGDNDTANFQLEALIGDYRHPVYRSSRSVHHLFLNPDPNLTGVSFDGFEFRAKGLQSVIPPSKHPDGTSYEWLVGSKFPVPPMPSALEDFYWQHRPDIKPTKPRRRVLKEGHVHPWCSVCGNRTYLHGKRFHLECQAFANLGYRWACRNCREFDVREDCRKLRKRSNKIRLAVPPSIRVAQNLGQHAGDLDDVRLKDAMTAFGML